MANLHHLRKVGAHSNQETRPCDSSSPRLTVAPDSQPLSARRKRKHRNLSSEHQNTQSESPNHSEPAAKRQRPSSCSSNTSTNSSSTDSSSFSWDRAERSYWDSLSRLWLTPNALREFNRRDALPRTQASPNEDIAVTRKQISIDISHFARRGGPDLSDIRQVCSIHLIKIIAH